jgi:hypothetical protein
MRHRSRPAVSRVGIEVLPHGAFRNGLRYVIRIADAADRMHTSKDDSRNHEFLGIR